MFSLEGLSSTMVDRRDDSSEVDRDGGDSFSCLPGVLLRERRGDFKLDKLAADEFGVMDLTRLTRRGRLKVSKNNNKMQQQRTNQYKQ